jgi:hypothetical protein
MLEIVQHISQRPARRVAKRRWIMECDESLIFSGVSSAACQACTLTSVSGTPSKKLDASLSSPIVR